MDLESRKRLDSPGNLLEKGALYLVGSDLLPLLFEGEFNKRYVTFRNYHGGKNNYSTEYVEFNARKASFKQIGNHIDALKEQISWYEEHAKKFSTGQSPREFGKPVARWLDDVRSVD